MIVGGENMVTFDEAEAELIECWQLLMRLPDREKGWLKSGSVSAWPSIVKDPLADYADPEAKPRRWLTQREMGRVARAFWDERCLAQAVPAQHQALFGMVIAAKGGRLPGGFEWSDVWTRMGGRATGVTSDALRMRYERALGKVAARMELLAGAGL